MEPIVPVPPSRVAGEFHDLHRPLVRGEPTRVARHETRAISDEYRLAVNAGASPRHALDQFHLKRRADEALTQQFEVEVGRRLGAARASVIVGVPARASTVAVALVGRERAVAYVDHNDLATDWDV